MNLADMPKYWREQSQESFAAFKQCKDKNSCGACMYMAEGDTLRLCADQLEIALKRVNATIDEIIEEASR